MKKFKQISISKLKRKMDSDGNVIINVPIKTKEIWFMKESNVPNKYLTREEYNNVAPKWFKEFLALYKSDQNENKRRWEEQAIFNKEMLEFKENQEVFNKNQVTFNKNQLVFNKNQEVFNKKQEVFNKKQEVFNKNQEVFNKKQLVFNKNQEVFNKNQEIFNKNHSHDE